MIRTLALLLPALSLSLPLAAQTFIVDASNGPGTSFLDLPPAIAQVPDGAVLRVRAGNYSAFTIANKSLTLLGDSRVTVKAQAFTIGPLTPAQRVVIKEVGHPGTFVLPVTFRIINAAGHVALDSYRFGGSLSDTPSMLLIQDSADVHLVDVTQEGSTSEYGVQLEIVRSNVEITGSFFVGSYQRSPTGTGYPGARAQNSRVTAFRSTFLGSIGGTDTAFNFGPGGPGFETSASIVDFGPGCVVTGGMGGYDPDGLFGRTIQRPGGPGLLASQLSTVRAMGATFTGGCSSGRVQPPNWSGCLSNAPARVVDATSSFTTLPGIAPVARVQGNQILNSFVDLVLQAGPNEAAVLAFGFSPAFVVLPPIIDFGGILTPPEIVFGPLFTDGTGAASFRLTLPNDFVVDRMVWAQYFTFPGLVLPGLGSNTVSIVVKS